MDANWWFGNAGYKIIRQHLGVSLCRLEVEAWELEKKLFEERKVHQLRAFGTDFRTLLAMALLGIFSSTSFYETLFSALNNIKNQ